MKKLLLIFLTTLLALPFIQSCNSSIDQPELHSLVTIKPDFNPAGFYGLLDNGERLYPGNMRVAYTAGEEDKRAIIFFSQLDENVIPGYTYNADIYNIIDIPTKMVYNLTDASLDTLGNNAVNIINAWISGGYLNMEYQTKIDPYNNKQIIYVNLVDNKLDGADHSSDSYYPLEFRVKVSPALEDGIGTLVSGMVCFKLGSLDPSNMGNEGILLKFNSNNETIEEMPVKPLVGETVNL